MTDKICTIAVDAMGGDYAPDAVVEGAKLASLEAGDRLSIILVGDEEKIRAVEPNLPEYRIGVRHASEVISMEDHPLQALKLKKDSSIARIAGLLQKKEVNAIFSAGNTGAFMAASLLAAGKIEGVNRPSIGVLYPTQKGTSFLLDVGANTDCKPHHLLHFGVMGATFIKHFLNIADPTVGLLSIGEEPTKGNAVTIEAHRLYTKSSLNFIGNIEGRDVAPGRADVIVCDGFVGNILLKLFETYGSTFEIGLRKQLGKNVWHRIGRSLIKKPFRRFQETFNYENHGGVPLLGIEGVSIIGHGHSSPLAIKTALCSAVTIYERNIQGEIRREIAHYKELC